jgi:hypothetical protein
MLPEMLKKNNSRKSPRTTIASIKKDMQEPRLTESVRNGYGKQQVAPGRSKSNPAIQFHEFYRVHPKGNSNA